MPSHDMTSCRPSLPKESLGYAENIENVFSSINYVAKIIYFCVICKNMQQKKPFLQKKTA